MSTKKDHSHLRHMLGVGPDRPRKRWGFRNYYYTSEQDAVMNRLVDAGLAHRGRPGGSIFGGPTMRFFHATRAGCLEAGMTEGMIKRMETQPQ